MLARLPGNNAHPPATPHQHMQRLDDQGTAYWLEDLALINGDRIARADVEAHGDTWLRVRESARDTLHDIAAMVWTIQTSHIVRFRLMEG